MRQAVLERHNKNTQSPSSRTRTQRGWAELSDAEMSQTLGPLLDIQKPRSPHHVIVDTLSCSAIFHKVCGDHHTVTGIPNRGEQKNIPSVSCKSPLCSDDKHPTLDTLDAIAIHGGFGDGQLGVRGHGIGPVVAIVKFFPCPRRQNHSHRNGTNSQSSSSVFPRTWSRVRLGRSRSASSPGASPS